MDSELENALNEQTRREFYAAYLYLAMSAAMAEQNFDGFSAWLRAQAQEEVGHAMRFLDHVLDRGGKVDLRMIESPGNEFGAPVDVFRAALEHERSVTAAIHHLYDIAEAKHDRAAMTMLQWFITEQVEEEKSAETVVARLERAADNAAALLVLDREMATRSGTGEE